MSASRRLAPRYAACAAIAAVGAVACACFVRVGGAPTPSGEDLNPVATGGLALCLFFAFTFALAAADAWFRAGRRSEQAEIRGSLGAGVRDQQPSKE